MPRRILIIFLGCIIVLCFCCCTFTTIGSKTGNINGVQYDPNQTSLTVKSTNYNKFETTTLVPTNTLLPSQTPSPQPSFTFVPTIKLTTKPIIKPTNTNTPVGGQPIVKYTCNCKKTCPNMTCEEAQYQLNVCGCKIRDRDGDGIACEEQCGL